jgi:glycosyltransferase involved in cell wall biosynthesis
MKKLNIAICVAHPIQHEIPLYQELSKIPELNVTVLYFSDFGIGSFNTYGLKNISYGIPMLEGYQYKILKNISPFKSYKLRFISPGVTKELKNGNFDRVMMYGYNSPTSVFVINYCKKHKIPLFLRGEGESILPVSKSKQLLRRLMLPAILKKFNCFVALGQANKEFYVQYGIEPSKIKMVPQTVNDNFFAGYDVANFQELRKKYNLIEGEMIFVYGSKQRADKRPMDAVRAFCQLDTSVNAKLLMLSDGPLRKECEDYAKHNDKSNRIIFTGYIDFTEMRDLFALSDVLILTSFETIGATLFQALFSGLALLSSDMVPGWLDLIKPGTTGLVYRAADIDALEKSIDSLASNSQLVNQMKVNVKALSNHYTSRKTALKLSDAFKNYN